MYEHLEVPQYCKSQVPRASELVECPFSLMAQPLGTEFNSFNNTLQRFREAHGANRNSINEVHRWYTIAKIRLWIFLMNSRVASSGVNARALILGRSRMGPPRCVETVGKTR